jgi:PAS domain S-box-containing protein
MNVLFGAIALLGFIMTSASAFYVLANNQGSRLGRLFFVYTSVTAAYNLFEFLAIITPSDPRADLYYRLGMMSFVLLMPTIFNFFVALAKREKMLSRLGFYFSVYLPVFALWYFVLNTHWFFADVRPSVWGGYVTVYGPAFRFLWLYAVLYVAAIVYYFRLVEKAATLTREKKQLDVFRSGMFVAFGFGLMGDIALPVFGVHLYSFIPTATVIYSLFFTYGFIRYGLFIISPATLAQNIIETMPDMLVFADIDKRIKLVNKAFRENMGYKDEEIVGQPCSLFHADEAAHQQMHQLIARQGVVTRQKVALKRKDGGELPFNISAMLIRDPLGEAIGSIVIYHDISAEQKILTDEQALVAELTKTKERMLSLLEDTNASRDEAKTKAEELARALEDLKSIDKMKTEFLSVISHELRTPLTPIRGYLDMIISGNMGALTDSQRKALQIILKENIHLQSLIDSVLDVSRMERGGLAVLDKKPILLQALLADLAEALKPEYAAREVRLEVNLPTDFPTIVGDANKLHRLLTNLLGNALKFTPKNGLVKVSGRAAEDKVTIEVSDNGIGVNKEHLPKLFTKFYQVDSSYTRTAGGVGLGLAIAKDIVTAHGGEIRAESPGLGQGTKVIFTLPIAG